MGTLYLVATPIGNLEDITLRALRILREVSLIAAEDTRTTRILLDHHSITTPTTSYHEHNKGGREGALLQALERGDVALVSDAGSPGISDPGFELVNAALAAGHTVSPVPGPSAVIAAVSASGLPTDQFVFVGFAPRRAGALADWVAQLRTETRTTVLYEAPHRIGETVAALAAAFPSRGLCLARELTKRFETFWRGRCDEAVAHLQAHPPRGEFVVVLAGAVTGVSEVWEEARVHAELRERLARGVSGRDAAAQVAALSGWSRRDVTREIDRVKYSAAIYPRSES
ncbi:MAG: 16S rRNA (cytidine(1402)-2'-O)-methyltransferase [Thermoflexales bacterium]|nr:16S rRNA (cytidine(1402)-2'-O)-methyltransferase [Thermoflexales bacterium]